MFANDENYKLDAKLLLDNNNKVLGGSRTVVLHLYGQLDPLHISENPQEPRPSYYLRKNVCL